MLHLHTLLLPLLLVQPSLQAPQLPLLLPLSGRADIQVEASNMGEYFYAISYIYEYVIIDTKTTFS